MGSSAKYTDEPSGQLKTLTDFLPSPDELEFREDKAIAPGKKDVGAWTRDEQPD